MIGMGMGDQDGVNPGHLVGEHLFPEIHRSINHDVEPARLDIDTRPASVVTGIL